MYLYLKSDYDNIGRQVTYTGKIKIPKLVSIGVRGGAQVMQNVFKIPGFYNQNSIHTGISYLKKKHLIYQVDEDKTIRSYQNSINFDVIYNTNGGYFNNLSYLNQYKGFAYSLKFEKIRIVSSNKGILSVDYGFGLICGKQMLESGTVGLGMNFLGSLGIGFNFSNNSNE